MTEIIDGGTLDNIKEKIKKYTLEDFSEVILHPHWSEALKEIYEGFAVISGNFLVGTFGERRECSNYFRIYTDDKELIAEFQKLFEENRKKNCK